MTNSNIDSRNIPQFDPEITQEESAYLDNLLKPFPELEEKNKFFASSKQAQKIRYICSLVLRDMMVIRTTQIDTPDSNHEKQLLSQNIRDNLGKLDTLGISSLFSKHHVDNTNPLELARSVAGQMLSIRQEVAIDESNNFTIANAASFRLGLPFTEEYMNLIKKWPSRPPVIPLR